MYDELVRRLRETSEWSNIKWEDYSDDAQETMREAADAIEELQKRVPPVPHGRLIDADALYERAKMRSERFNGCFNDLDNVINALYIETFPTVLEAEEGE